MNRYASGTSVSVEKSKAEIETLLRRYGATKFASQWDEEGAAILFQIGARQIRIELPLPRQDEKRFAVSPGGRARRTPDQRTAAWEQACRASWRALLLVIRAKLEAIEAKISTLDAEFLSYIVVAGGETVGEKLRSQLEAASHGGQLLLGPKTKA